MKKILLTVALVLTATLVIPVGFASAPTPPTISKSFDVEEAGLCDHVDGEITVETYEGGVVVTDEMPEGLALVNVTVSGGDYDLDWDEDSIEVTLDDSYTEYIISFEVQVTDVLSDETVTVTNYAQAALTGAPLQTASDDLDLLPYTDFYKWLYYARYWDVDSWVYPLQDEIPVNTKVYFLMWVDCFNSISITMQNASVKDNLGGNLELNEWNIFSVGTVTERLTGNTEKSHLLWEIGNIVPGNGAISDLYVSTDTNTGTGNGKKPGKQEYTDEEPTTHELNSGATLKFTASDTGLQCSVSTPPVEIQTIIPD